MTDLTTFRAALNDPEHMFASTLAYVEQHYDYRPSGFDNAGLVSAAGQNEGSCKTLGLAQLESFSKDETLRAFGEHYRSVLATLEGHDHGNIRALLANGLEQVKFAQPPLSRKR